MSEGFLLKGNERLLVVRLGAMGDILHALPAVESLKRRYPATAIDWIAKPRWMPLLEGNPSLRRAIPFDRESGSVFATARRLRDSGYGLAIDMQGLLQSAIVTRFCGAARTAGYASSACREPLAAWFYRQRVTPASTHIAEKHLDLVRALGVNEVSLDCWLPQGEPEGQLPDVPFVLASPFAGWQSKQWPLSHYANLARLLLEDAGLTLVMNVAEADLPRLREMAPALPHVSSLAGLIDATRRATAVVGVDSGPLHLAAALGKPGVALFGPTDPARNGPVSKAIAVLRDATAATSYKRDDVESECMRRLTPEAVFAALQRALQPTAALRQEKERIP
ncbi:MAG: glycosyltransferase family 9 protein [Bryobacterales bacterium]|nr:glycosyltransferase family 9 protein [Bryobacterales bacterium]